jgi:hypothetical protein
VPAAPRHAPDGALGARLFFVLAERKDIMRSPATEPPEVSFSARPTQATQHSASYIRAMTIRPPPVPTRTAAEERVRVYVRTSARDPSLLVVRLLADHESAPSGTREAYLVFADEEATVNERATLVDIDGGDGWAPR